VASITNGENAVNVLGQPDFTSSGAATTQAGLNNPLGLEYDTLNQRLFVAQGGGNRVTVYSVAAITNGENAVNVLGQADFTSSGSATTQAGLNNPIGLVYNESTSEVYVSQTTNGNRVSVFDAAVVGFTKNKTSVNASEGQTTPPTFTLVLTGAPTTDVVLNISVDNTTSISVSPATLTFTNSNWSTPQTVTVTALEDENLVVDNGTITISVDPAQSDDAFDDVLNQTITVTAFDNDRPPQAGGGGSSGPPPVTPTTPLVPDLITPPPSESPEDEDEANAEEDVGELEEQPAVCVIPQYPTAFIKFGSKNDTEQVKLLEQFLNLFMGADLAVDGIYDSKDRQVVIALQERYQEEILAPWKLKQGTGYVYIKTLAKIKLLVESRCR
jgi:hypothetical protein